MSEGLSLLCHCWQVFRTVANTKHEYSCLGFATAEVERTFGNIGIEKISYRLNL